MISTIKYLSDDKHNAFPLYDISEECKFDVLWQKAKKLCIPGQSTRFVITQKDDNSSADLLLCWFAVYANDTLTLLWHGSMKSISSIDAEIQAWKNADVNIERNLTSMPYDEVLCYHDGKDVRFLTPQAAYIGSLETEMENWKSYIYL